MNDPLPIRSVAAAASDDLVCVAREGALLLLLLLLASLCALPLTAQNVTIPAVMDGVEGGGGTNIPFGSSQACRYQCIYDAEELPWSGPRVITGVRIRPDLHTGAAVPAKGFLQVSVLMSTSPRKAADASADFADNYGIDATWVVQNRIIQLPAQPAVSMPSTVPRPANIDFTFSIPWAYGLTPATQELPAPDSLLVEIWITSQPAGSYRVDNLSSCIAPTTEFGLADAACAVPGNQPVALSGDSSMLAGNIYHWNISGGAPSGPWMLMMNLTDQGGLLGNPAWPLPYPMFDPANPAQPSAALTLFGQPAPDCYFNLDPVVLLPGVCDASGYGTVAAALPAGRQHVGKTFYTQALVLSPTSNPLWFITSKGRSTTVCGPLGVTRVYAFYDSAATPPPPPPATGTLSRGVGLVLEVY